MGYWYIFDTWLDDNSVGCWAYYDLHRWGDRWNIIFNLLVDLWNRDGVRHPNIYIQGLYSIFNINMIVRHQKVLLNPKAGTHWDDAKRIGDFSNNTWGLKTVTLKLDWWSHWSRQCLTCRYYAFNLKGHIYIHNSIYIHIYILAWYSLASKPFKELAHARLQHYDVYKPWWV